MIWLALNCGFGNTDGAELRWTDVGLDHCVLPRGKTGIWRDLSLWPETVGALRAVPRTGPLVFYTSHGNPWVRHNDNHRHIDTVSKMFGDLLRKAGLNVPKYTSFYNLRHTGATIAAKTKDP